MSVISHINQGLEEGKDETDVEDANCAFAVCQLTTPLFILLCIKPPSYIHCLPGGRDTRLGLKDTHCTFTYTCCIYYAPFRSHSIPCHEFIFRIISSHCLDMVQTYKNRHHHRRRNKFPCVRRMHSRDKAFGFTALSESSLEGSGRGNVKLPLKSICE